MEVTLKMTVTLEVSNKNISENTLHRVSSRLSLCVSPGVPKKVRVPGVVECELSRPTLRMVRVYLVRRFVSGLRPPGHFPLQLLH